MLLEVVHQVDEAKFRQRVGNELDVQVLVLILVHVEISQKDGIFSLEALQGLLKIEEVGQHGCWDVCSNNRSLGQASDGLAAYQVPPVEVC